VEASLTLVAVLADIYFASLIGDVAVGQ